MENNKLTTEEDFQFFKSEALRFMELFGMKDWEILFTHENEYPDYRAWVDFKNSAHIARLSLNKDWSRQILVDQIKPELLSRAAFHEVCHCFSPVSRPWPKADTCRRKTFILKSTG